MSTKAFFLLWLWLYKGSFFLFFFLTLLAETFLKESSIHKSPVGTKKNNLHSYIYYSAEQLIIFEKPDCSLWKNKGCEFKFLTSLWPLRIWDPTITPHFKMPDLLFKVVLPEARMRADVSFNRVKVQPILQIFLNTF